MHKDEFVDKSENSINCFIYWFTDPQEKIIFQKEKGCIKSQGVNNFEFEDQGQFNLFCLLGNMQVSSVASERQY